MNRKNNVVVGTYFLFSTGKCKMQKIVVGKGIFVERIRRNEDKKYSFNDLAENLFILK